MKFVYILGIIIITIIIFIAWNYPAYQRSMSAAHERILDNETLELDEGVIQYKIQGEGDPVLLLHGAGGGYDQGLWFGKVGLGDSYKLISVSRFGYLNSSVPNNPSIKKQSEVYKLLLDKLGIEKVVVLAGSAGGPSALEFAKEYPDRVSKILLLSAVTSPPTSTDKDPFYIKVMHTIQKSDYSYWLTTKYFERMILNLIGINDSTYDKFTAEQKDLAQEMLDIMHPMSKRYAGTALDSKMIMDYSTSESIATPTLILHAIDDALVSYYHAENAHEKIKGSQLVLFDDGGHGMLSHVDEVRQKVKTFLSE